MSEYIQNMVNEVAKINKEYSRVKKIKLTTTQKCELENLIYEHHSRFAFEPNKREYIEYVKEALTYND